MEDARVVSSKSNRPPLRYQQVLKGFDLVHPLQRLETECLTVQVHMYIRRKDSLAPCIRHG